MTEQQYRDGEVIFREGDISDLVCRILSGTAEVTKSSDDQEVVVGTAGPGEYIGEMGVIAGQRRTATVRASGDLTAELINKEDFLRQVSENSGLALQLLARLSERLSTLDRAFTELAAKEGLSEPTIASVADAAPEQAPAACRISILPGSDTLAGLMPSNGIVLDRLPFTVGREPGAREDIPDMAVNLVLKDSQPYRLSRMHFSVVRRNGDVIVRDLNSALGTEVNGEFLGKYFGTDVSILKSGENRITAGGAKSPFMFRLVLEDD